MTRYPALYILRHGQTVWNASGRMQGRADSPLTALGVSQAGEQGEILANEGLEGFSAWCSPLGRAQQTAQIVVTRRRDASSRTANDGYRQV